MARIHGIDLMWSFLVGNDSWGREPVTANTTRLPPFFQSSINVLTVALANADSCTVDGADGYPGSPKVSFIENCQTFNRVVRGSVMRGGQIIWITTSKVTTTVPLCRSTPELSQHLLWSTSFPPVPPRHSQRSWWNFRHLAASFPPYYRGGRAMIQTSL